MLRCLGVVFEKSGDAAEQRARGVPPQHAPRGAMKKESDARLIANKYGSYFRAAGQASPTSLLSQVSLRFVQGRRLFFDNESGISSLVGVVFQTLHLDFTPCAGASLCCGR